MQKAIESASALLSQGKAVQAEQQLRNFINETPEHEEGLALLGHSLLMQNKAIQAIEIFQQLTNKHPKSANAQVELASALLTNGELVEAKKHFQCAVELDPTYSEAWHFLGNCIMEQGDKTRALSCFKQAERHDVFRPQLLQVQKSLDEKSFHQAEKLSRAVLLQHPNHPQALHTLAILAERVKAYEQAINILQRGLSYAPFHLNLLELLVKNLSHLGKLAQAIEVAKKLVDLSPEQPRYLIKLATELVNSGQFEQGASVYQQALKISPDDASIHLQLGHALKTLGRRQECEKSYQKSLTLEKINGTAYWALADLKSYLFSDLEVNNMTALLSDNSVKPDQVSQVAFALAKHYEDNQDYEKSFNYYQQANKIRPDVLFNADEYKNNCLGVIQAFNQQTLNAQTIVSNKSVTPIFIVGLTRSGSTLLEQMLASHSAIEGTMELYSMPRTVRQAEMLAAKKGKSYPADIASFSKEDLSALGQYYLDDTAQFRTDKAYFIDKMPPNFHNIGLIHMILPNAIIIDARRHPMSVGFSNFKQHFARGYDFSYNLENIGHYYNSYLSLMDYWQQALPNKILCMQYEDMVKNSQKQLQRLLAHCGLAYEEQCLKFYQNKRAVRTASSEQVRQPIYTKGMQQWKNFDAYLTPLKEALGQNTLRRFKQWL